MLVFSLREYKAWFDGFAQGINGAPTKEQWETIKKKMDEISEKSHHNYCNALHTRSPIEHNFVAQLPVITCTNNKRHNDI